MLTVGVFGGLALVGAVLALAQTRPTEFTRFRTDSGVFPLDVGRVGPDVKNFDEFVDLLIAEIQWARPAAEPPSSQPMFQPRLYGTWRSDAVATLSRLRNDP